MHFNGCRTVCVAGVEGENVQVLPTDSNHYSHALKDRSVSPIDVDLAATESMERNLITAQ